MTQNQRYKRKKQCLFNNCSWENQVFVCKCMQLDSISLFAQNYMKRILKFYFRTQSKICQRKHYKICHNSGYLGVFIDLTSLAKKKKIKNKNKSINYINIKHFYYKRNYHKTKRPHKDSRKYTHSIHQQRTDIQNICKKT